MKGRQTGDGSATFGAAAAGKRGVASLGVPEGRLRPAAAAAVLAGLSALSAAAPAGAQTPTCTPAFTGTLPTVGYGEGTHTGILCETLTDGLTLTVEPGAAVGTDAAPINIPYL